MKCIVCILFWSTAFAADQAEACYQQAKCYLKGDGVEKDEEQAFVWFAKAANQDHFLALCWLGALYTRRCHLTHAIVCFQRAQEVDPAQWGEDE